MTPLRPTAEHDMDIIFSSNDLAVYFRGGVGDTLAITFSNWTSVTPQPLWSKWIPQPAVFFVALNNHWYQIDEIDAAIDRLEPLVSDYDSRVLLGSSMGGFAAIALADRLKATRAVAISPQISLNRIIAPFETRWRKEAASVKEWIVTVEDSTVPTHVIYDPEHGNDAMHALAIKNKRGSTFLWRFPFSGHPTGFALADLSMLETIVKSSFLIDAEDCAYALLSEEYLSKYTNSVTAILNDFRYGHKRALSMSEAERQRLLGTASKKEQLAKLISGGI